MPSIVLGEYTCLTPPSLERLRTGSAGKLLPAQQGHRYPVEGKMPDGRAKYPSGNRGDTTVPKALESHCFLLVSASQAFWGPLLISLGMVLLGLRPSLVPPHHLEQLSRVGVIREAPVSADNFPDILFFFF